MIIRVVRGSGRKPPLYHVCTTVVERGDSVGTDETLFSSRSFYDASLVLRFLNGGNLTDEQLNRYIALFTKNADAQTDDQTDRDAR